MENSAVSTLLIKWFNLRSLYKRGKYYIISMYNITKGYYHDDIS